jgi:site-specific DNA-methyltransferase (adenine-specific)
MKPYYETENGKLYHGDCLEIMPLLEPVDLVLTDPPYGKQWARGENQVGLLRSKNERRENLSWDRAIPKKEIFNLIFKKSKNQIIWGGNYFINYLSPTNCFLVWDKTGGKSNKKMPFSDCELAWTSFNSVARIIHCRNNGFIKESKEKRFHPTQKPLMVFIDVLNDFSFKSDVVCDPFIGSGTTAVSCERLNRKWIGIEISEKYCEIASLRIEAENRQMKLFN